MPLRLSCFSVVSLPTTLEYSWSIPTSPSASRCPCHSEDVSQAAEGFFVALLYEALHVLFANGLILRQASAAPID